MVVYTLFLTLMIFSHLSLTRGLRSFTLFSSTRSLIHKTQLLCLEDSSSKSSSYIRGQQVKLRVLQFGPIGASVETVDDSPPTRGIIYRKEILLHRQKQQGEDLFQGEELDGYVEKVLDDGRLNILLRPAQIVSRIKSTQELIIEALEGSPSNTIPIGDKSSPEDISRYLHGITKTDFKMAIGALYKEGVCIPGAFETKYVPETDRKDFQRNKNTPAVGLQRRKLPEDRNIAASIFIGNLPLKITKELLLDVSNKVLGEGTVKSVLLSLDEAGKPRGFGYIELTEEILVESSIKLLKSINILGRKIKVDFADPLRKHNYQTQQETACIAENGEKRNKRVSDDREKLPMRNENKATETAAFSSQQLSSTLSTASTNQVGSNSVVYESEKDELSIDDLPYADKRSKTWASGKTDAANESMRPRVGDAQAAKGWVQSALRDISKKNRSVRQQDYGGNEDITRRVGNDAASKRHTSSVSPGVKGEATLFIGNLAFSVTEETLQTEIEKFSGPGSVASVRVITDRETGRSRGFAYVEMLKTREAEQVYNRMHNIEIMGRRIQVDDATKR